MQLKIKTLPNFHISKNGAATIGSTCILLAQDAPILSSRKPQRRTLNRFFSGAYNIMGFKHVIASTGVATSEFELVKVMPNPEPEQMENEGLGIGIPKSPVGAEYEIPSVGGQVQNR